MDDAITRAGPNLTTGPGAEYMLKLKQAAQNWLGVDLKGLPEAEVVTKLNAQLAAQAAKAMTARPSQLEFKAFMANNPGLQNSVAGTKYLIDVLRQATTQDIQLGQLASRVQDPRAWPAVEDRFYQQNPIKSPFSGQPLSGDERAVGRNLHHKPDRRPERCSICGRTRRRARSSTASTEPARPPRCSVRAPDAGRQSLRSV